MGHENLELLLTFGDAIKVLKRGKKVFRKSWNGKNMWINLVSTCSTGIEEFPVQPCIWMKTTDDKRQPGWVPSQADMLAEDWAVVF